MFSFSYTILVFYLKCFGASEIGQQKKTLLTKPENLNSVSETNIAEGERKIRVCVCSCVSAQIYIAAINTLLIVETYSRFPIIK